MDFLEDLYANAQCSGEHCISGIADLITGDLSNSDFYVRYALFPQIWGLVFWRKEEARGKCAFIIGLHFTD